jgi:two-component system invasion response regulator UvrY
VFILIKILLVDDHGLVRHGIKKLLEAEPGINVIAEAESGEEAIKIARQVKPHVVLMDVNMPGIGGLEATRKLVRTLPDVKVLAVTAMDADPFPSRLLQAGAAGFLTKGADSKEMVEAIKTVFMGRRYISPSIAQNMALKSLGEQDENPFEALSERELQIAMMITNKQKVVAIAEKLCLSSKTVNSYRYRIFEKLGIQSDVELTHLALRYGIVDKAGIMAE